MTDPTVDRLNGALEDRYGQGQSGVVAGDARRILVQNFFQQLKEQVGN